jgi:hypothetical protein
MGAPQRGQCQVQPRVYICDECIAVCHSILSDLGEDSKPDSSSVDKAELSANTRAELLSRLASIKALKPIKALLLVLVIDHVEQPSPN